MPLKTKTTSLIALIAALTFGSGCAAEEEITEAANEVEAGLLQDQLDAVVDGGARGAILFVDDPNSDPIELSAGVSSAQAEASMEEATSSLEEDEGLVVHGEESCGEWDGDDGSGAVSCTPVEGGGEASSTTGKRGAASGTATTHRRPATSASHA